MYKNYLIIASKKDKAGINITTNLSQYEGHKFYLVDEEIIYDESLDEDKIDAHDFIIFASKHKSEKGGKTISIHAPGNWRDAEHGGRSGKASMTSALFQKHLFEKLNEQIKEHDLKDYRLTLECTHHGPLIEKPCIFVEIGSGENEWRDHRAGFVVAKSIHETIKEFKENPYREIAVGIGGPHYCPNFNKLQLESNVAFSHIIPSYALPLSESMILEAIDKTCEELDFVVLDWKGIGNEEQRKQLIEILDKNYVAYKKINDLSI